MFEPYTLSSIVAKINISQHGRSKPRFRSIDLRAEAFFVFVRVA